MWILILVLLIGNVIGNLLYSYYVPVTPAKCPQFIKVV
jgi:hypothetical protein